MSLSQRLLPAVLAVSSAFAPVAVNAATPASNGNAAAASTSDADLTAAKRYAAMPISQWPALKDEQFAAYDKISRLYVNQVKKLDANLGQALETYLVIGADNNGLPKGRERYEEEINKTLHGDYAAKGVTADNSTLYGPIVAVGSNFVSALRKAQAQAQSASASTSARP